MHAAARPERDRPVRRAGIADARGQPVHPRRGLHAPAPLAAQPAHALGTAPPAAGHPAQAGTQAAQGKPRADPHESRRHHRCHTRRSAPGDAQAWRAYPDPRPHSSAGRTPAGHPRPARPAHRARPLGPPGLGPGDRRQRPSPGALPALTHPRPAMRAFQKHYAIRIFTAVHLDVAGHLSAGSRSPTPHQGMIVIISKGNLIKFVAAPVGVLALGFGLFNGVFFYNEAGFMTHVRTIFGDEKIVDDVGYATKWFGRATTWKKAISVQSVLVMDDNDTNPDNDGLGATIEAFPIVFLGNVDAKVESSARFRLPGGEPFLKMAQEYRNPDNFIRTALVPAIKETLQATASLMSADDYYAGARSEFAAEFENQLNDGLYLIKRKEVRGPRGAIPHQTAILQAGTEQGAFGDNNASQFVTEKVTDAKGIPVRKQQQFRKFGVEVVEARITNVDPNPQYKQRMVKVQQALAELAVARQNRLKEEEEKLLVTARGEKEVEAKRQETLRDQIERTTQAETDKQLAVINAEREKQRAEIEKQTAELLRDKATVTAQATKITADAEAYAREAVIKADGALQPKLDALIAINKVWAEAAAQAPVPSVMMGAGANGAASRQDEIGQLMGVLATKAARDLALDLKVKD
ncbi:hypothetical protein PAMH19_5129 [Pseudomonas aeruginosa]|nr:hypothetical protein PAMH19_5129 [Pseudomonas aeruginosa]